MKKVINYKWPVIILLFMLLTPAFMGWCNFAMATRVIWKTTNITDSDIETVDAAFYFDLGWEESPGFRDYWQSGYKTIKYSIGYHKDPYNISNNF
jgi:hypothetical protein